MTVGGEQQPGHDGRRPADRVTFPHQDDQRRDEQERRADVGEDVLLDVELKGVEQHGTIASGQPAPGAEMDENRVDQYGRAQPEQVLYGSDHGEVVDQHRRDEQQRVAAGAQPVRRPVSVDKVPGVLRGTARCPGRSTPAGRPAARQRGARSAHPATTAKSQCRRSTPPAASGELGVRYVGMGRAPTWRGGTRATETWSSS